jgi:hypothetical protein
MFPEVVILNPSSLETKRSSQGQGFVTTQLVRIVPLNTFVTWRVLEELRLLECYAVLLL